MILTAVDMYRAFLDGIKKEQSTIVPPSTFNRLINEEQDKWFKEKAPATELDQKRIDDLQILRTDTDGVYEYGGTVLNPIGTDALSSNVFSLPVDPTVSITTINQWLQPLVPPLGQPYPRYRRLQSIEFRIRYVNNVCGHVGLSEWLEARIMRSDKRTALKHNPYRKPSDEKLYYEIKNNKIRLITGTQSYGVGMRLEYLRWPVDIYFDTTGAAHIDCELLPEQQQEIVDRAVVTYIERSKNPRYQTVMHESAKQQQFK